MVAFAKLHVIRHTLNMNLGKSAEQKIYLRELLKVVEKDENYSKFWILGILRFEQLSNIGENAHNFVTF